MPIKLISGAGGSLTVQPASTASNYTLTVPAVTANVITSGDTATVTQTMLGSSIAGNGPAFSVYSSTTQTVTTATDTKIQLNTKTFDTASCFDSATNYRFTPNIAGYYQINVGVRVSGTFNAFCYPILYKNGSSYRLGTAISSPVAGSIMTMSELIYCNGTTDYIELWGQLNGTGTLTFGGPSINVTNYMSGFLARAA